MAADDSSASRPLPPAVLERVADRFRLLGDPTRLRVVNEMHAAEELSVGELVERVGMSYGVVSKHLALLRSHGLVQRRREGTRIFYRIVDPSLSEVCDVVCKSVREHWQLWGAMLEEDLPRELQVPEVRKA